MAKAPWTDTQITTQLNSGYLWTGSNLTYGFPTDASWFNYAEATGFSTLNADQRVAATLSIRLWDDLMAPDFTLAANPNTASIRFSNTTSNISYAHAYYPGGWNGAGSVWFNTNYGAGSGTNNLQQPVVGNWGWAAYVHETGHALGLNHAGNYNGGSPTYDLNAAYLQDTQMYSIMSYFSAAYTGADWYASDGAWHYAQTPMINDIMAIQAMYGVETTTRIGDTIYGFNSNLDVWLFNFAINLHPVVSIFDSAGIDTLDLSGWNTPSLIDLTPGAFSNADMMTFNISIARTAWIENAVGGGGNDTLIGNILANALTGNGGDDNFTGGGGNDTILGGLGLDTVNFSGNFANYSISWNATLGAYVLVDTRGGAPNGTDTVKDVETFVFADGTRTAASLLTGTPSSYTISPAAASATESSGQLTFTVTRSGDLSAAGTVNWAASGSGVSPVSGADFVGGVLPSGTASFAAGVATQTVTLAVQNDTVVEANEGVTVTLSAPSGGATLSTSTAAGTILNDDAAPPVLSIAATDASKMEGLAGSTPFTFTITRTGDISAAGTVNWAVSGGTATASDFTGGTLPIGTASFVAGQATQLVTVNVAGETVIEGDETFTVVLSGPSGGATLGTSAALGTILNDDAAAAPTISIAATDASKSEGDSGSTPFTFTITRTGDISAAGTVNWAVSGGTATASDFTGGVLPGGTASFLAGQATQLVTVNVAGEGLVEGNETFGVTLSGPSGGATLGTASATGTILNNDSAFSIIGLDASKVEGSSGSTPFTFTIARSGDVSGTASVAWSVAGSGGAPASAADFANGTLPGGTVTFAAGQTSQVITINVAGDSTVENNETFAVSLSAPSGLGTSGAMQARGALPGGGSAGMVSLGTATATGTIINDDAAPAAPVLSVAATDATKAEGNAGTTAFTFTVTRSGDTSVAGSVGWQVTAGANPVSAADFVGGILPAGALNFAAGVVSQVITVNVAGDTILETNEGFTVTLANPSAGFSLGTASAAGTILNDETNTSYIGTTGNDDFNASGSTQTIVFDISQGGNDTATGGSAADSFMLGASLTAADSINGGAGIDTLSLAGNYAAALTLGAATFTNVERINLAAGGSYNLITNDATVAAGGSLTIDASALASINGATVNGSAELNGAFTFLGGAGVDAFTGGAGADIFRAGTGADVLNGNAGADSFVYTSAADLPLTLASGVVSTANDDLIQNFAVGSDQIDLSAFGFTGASASIFNRAINGYTSQPGTGAGFYNGSGVAVEYTRNGKLARLYVDSNHDNALNAGDLLIQLTGISKGSLSMADIKFA